MDKDVSEYLVEVKCEDGTDIKVYKAIDYRELAVRLLNEHQEGNIGSIVCIHIKDKQGKWIECHKVGL